MNSQLTEYQDKSKLIESIATASDVVSKNYLYNLSDYEVATLPQELIDLKIEDYTRLYKFTRMVSDKNENVLDKLVTVLNSIYCGNGTIITLICGKKDRVDYYLGVVNKDIEQKNTTIEVQGEILKGVLSGNFPGLEYTAIKGDEKRKLINNAFVYDYITSISGISSIRKENNESYEKYVQGIEHLVDSLQGCEYNIVIIADPVPSERISESILGYESLYSQISPFLSTQLSFNESESLTITNSQTEGISKTIGESTSLTQNYSQTSGWSNTTTTGTSKTKNVGQAIGTVVGIGAAVAAVALTGGVALPAAMGIAGLGAGVGGAVGGGIFGSKTSNKSEASTENGSTTKTSGNTKTKSRSTTEQESTTQSEAEGQTRGRTVQICNENKVVKDLLDTIDKNIERLKKCETYGAFNCAAYVISSNPEINTIVASGYNALMRGDNSSLQTSHINSWNKKNDAGRAIGKYLEKLSHPLFVNPHNTSIVLSPATISNSYELAVGIGLPKKSIKGLPVIECAEFGRNVISYNSPSANNNSLPLGHIFHMNHEESTEVFLSKDSLASHTFVTGSTGSGKSNTIYHLVNEARKTGAKFLVIEPAKGEYKNVFCNDDVFVYGTNPKVAPLLRINPFSFPSDIHILEHLDRLIEIFNVCWPMYAAMPAVLKNAVELSYEDCGWDLVTSENTYGNTLYPTFADVSRNVKRIIDSSEYDTDNKGAYKGSLLTRLNSLTNGINGLIFQSDEISSKEMFDQNVIVDLSRVGSNETKSLIMGMLVLKLQEHRMSESEMNAKLKHITVLEEAHNLLKRTSSEQSSESSNLAGKSVEMISNAIAEMRTYGEGFVIADQAPGLLDMAAIRNTNTKIILRLPDESDRELVGRAANLNDSQITELAKLPCGVAAIYQNEWIQPVLCKVDRFDVPDGNYIYHQTFASENVNPVNEKLRIATLLSNCTAVDKEIIIKDIIPQLQLMKLSASICISIIRWLENPPAIPKITKLAPIMAAMFPEILATMREVYQEETDEAEWTRKVEKRLSDISEVNIEDQVRRDIVQSIITHYFLIEKNDINTLKLWSERGGLK